MKAKLFILLAAVASLAACNQQPQINQNNMNMNNETINEVAGRKNFGAKHALMTTPQPCVMIATWDENQNHADWKCGIISPRNDPKREHRHRMPGKRRKSRA